MKEEVAIKTIHLAKKYIASLKNAFRSNGYEISFEEWMVLLHVGLLKQISQTKVAEYTGKDRHFTSRLIQGLEKKDLLERSSDKNDPRVKVVILTDFGFSVFKDLSKIQKNLYGQSLGSLDSSELKTLNDILSKLL